MSISLVVPAYNEAEALPLLVERVTAVLDSAGEAFELLLVDDGSRDATWEVIRSLAAADPRVRGLHLARNFGHQIALTAGMEHATGEAVITLDADLQHPPELLPELLARWREGHEIVYTERTDTAGVGLGKKLTSRLFYAVINRASATRIPLNAADFRLLDRQVVDALARLPERARFLRGLIAWVGFRQAVVPFTAGERAAGETKYTLRKMLRFALDAITGFSSLPLQAAGCVGFVVSALGFLYGLVVLYCKLFTDLTQPGWTSLICIVLFLGGLQLMSLGIVGEYIARIYEEVKGRPLYLVAEQVGLGAGRADG